MLNRETNEILIKRLQNMEAIDSLRTHLAQARKSALRREPATEAEIERSQAVVQELMDETERLGLY